jgi:hypothetical protein
MNPVSELLGWLTLAVVFGGLMVIWVRIMNARRRAFWAPLVPLIAGNARGLRMSGTYQQHDVIADRGPVSDVGPRSPNHSAWCFTVSLDPIPGGGCQARRRRSLRREGGDWLARYGYELPTMARGQPAWHITGSRKRLCEALRASGLLAELEHLDSYPEIGYNARSRLISITEDHPERMTPELFRSRLDLLVRLAR